MLLNQGNPLSEDLLFLAAVFAPRECVERLEDDLEVVFLELFVFGALRGGCGITKTDFLEGG